MIKIPTILIDKYRCLKNIEAMANKAAKSEVKLRPHFKTHQSLEVGCWFKDLDVKSITVSSIKMAAYFATEWDDITVAFPVNILEIDEINALASQNKLGLLVESEEAIQFLSENLTSAVSIYIKIDVGTNRTGINTMNFHLIERILAICTSSSMTEFKGFIAHAGHTYACRDSVSIQHIYNVVVSELLDLKEKYVKKYPSLIVSYGDTPSCSVVENFHGVDEIRPGNFIYYDLMQEQIRSCELDQIGVAVACPVVAIHAERNEVVVYGGGVHFSKDSITHSEFGNIYGQAVEWSGETWGSTIPSMYLTRLSQEHGILHVPDSRLQSIKLGDLVYILPVHSCMTMDLLRRSALII